MRRIWLVLAGLAVLAGQGRGPAQVGSSPGAGYEITPQLGPWMIITAPYTGPQAYVMARRLADELRTNYRLPAYIYNYSDEERRKERERIAETRRRQQEYLARMNLDPNTSTENMPANIRRATTIRIRTRRFEDQCAVLIGGFKDQETARKELDRIRKLKPPDPKRVPLASVGISNPITQSIQRAYENPFLEAFTVPNPMVKQAPPPERNKPDPFLKELNAHEPFSLLKCSGRFTLAVAQFRGATVIQSRSDGGSTFLDKLGLGGKAGEMLNASAVNAHNVADLLHKLNFDAYVLHTRFASVVTVGNYDTPNDPQLKAMQQRLARLKLDPIPMLPQALPMEIPRL